MISLNFLFKKLYILFLINWSNWTIITLLYYEGFCHTSAWIGHRCACVTPSWTLFPSPSPPCPSGLFQSSSSWCLASCIELALVIYFAYGNVHVLMLFSQIMLSLPSPKVQKSVLYICVSFDTLHVRSSLLSF